MGKEIGRRRTQSVIDRSDMSALNCGMRFGLILPLIAVLSVCFSTLAFGQDVSEVELEFWRSIRDSQNIEEYQAYVDLYPEGQFLSLAKIRMKTLLAEGGTVAETPADDEPVVETATNVDDVLWLTLKDSGNLAEIENFLTTFPDSQHAAAAGDLRDTLLAGEVTPQTITADDGALTGTADGFFDDGKGAGVADSAEAAPSGDQFDLASDDDWLGEGDSEPEPVIAVQPDQAVVTSNIPLGLRGETGYLGVSLQNAGADDLVNLPAVVQVKISSVLPYSSAEQAGLLPGDFLLSFNGYATGPMNSLVGRIAAQQPGDDFTIRVIRNGEQVQLDGQLASRRHQLESGIAADHTATIESTYRLRVDSPDFLSVQSMDRLLSALLASADRETPAARFALAMFKLYGLVETGIDENTARRYLQTAADAGLTEAAANIGDSLMYGILTFPKNLVLAERYLLAAAAKGSVAASTDVGVLYAYYQEFEDKEAQAPAYLRYAADNGDSRAQSVLGQLYFDGTIVSQDYDLAITYLEPAATGEITSAKMYLARALAEGLGISKDHTRAERLFLEAAEADYWSAPYYLANFYFDDDYAGENGEAKSLKWFLTDAGKGDASSSYALAWLYSFSDQVPRDANAAAHYILEAIERGNEFALQMMREDPNTWPEEMRRAVQDKLQQKGVYSGGIDGKMGAGTQAGLSSLLGISQ